MSPKEDLDTVLTQLGSPQAEAFSKTSKKKQNGQILMAISLTFMGVPGKYGENVDHR